jgi:hypothetical protein
MTKWQLVIPVKFSNFDEKEFRRRCIETAYLGVEKIYPGDDPSKTVIHFVDARLTQDEGPSHVIRREVTRLACDDPTINPSVERIIIADKCDDTWIEVECPNPAVGYTYHFGQYGHKIAMEYCDSCYKKRLHALDHPVDKLALLFERKVDRETFTRY